MAKTTRSYIGLGGNIGDVFSNMQSAISYLGSHAKISVKALSLVYKTPPWGIEDQDWFLNACAEVETSLTAQELLQQCLEAEKQLNRVRDIRWGPRTIDLDVLIYGNEEIASDALNVPHPRMHERAFVLLPMADLNADLILKGKSIAEWLELVDLTEIQKTDLKLTL